VGGATPAAISESMAAIDTINGVGGVTILVQAETLSASDHPDAAALRPAAVSESVNAIATTDAVASAQINESLTVLDACSAILITEGSIAENTASAQDTVAAATLWEVFVAEAAAPADHPDFFVFFPPVFMDESPGSMARGAQIGGRLGIPAPAGTTTEGKID
jgi:hypothetical protein